MTTPVKFVFITSAFAFYLAGAASGLAGAGHSAAESSRARARFGARVVAGDVFKRAFGPDFVFALEPMLTGDAPVGWKIVIRRGPAGRTNLAEMTTPWRGPSELDVVDFFPFSGQHAPLPVNRFIFSPEVGDTITWQMLDPGDPGHAVTHVLLRRIEEFGKGTLTIRKFGLTAQDAEARAPIAWIEFQAELTWPRAYTP